MRRWGARPAAACAVGVVEEVARSILALRVLRQLMLTARCAPSDGRAGAADGGGGGGEAEEAPQTDAAEAVLKDFYTRWQVPILGRCCAARWSTRCSILE